MEQNLLLQNIWWENADLNYREPHRKRADILTYQYQPY
jgi:hypothetical protein